MKVDAEKIFFFNSGREYSKFGQRILYAKLHEVADNYWIFYDMDRGICGSFHSSYREGPELSHVMAAYDNYLFTHAAIAAGEHIKTIALMKNFKMDDRNFRHLPKTIRSLR